MRKILLSMAAVLMALAANAQGITSVGANIPILKSARWSNEPYKAKVLVATIGQEYGEWNDMNVNYNMLVLEDGPVIALAVAFKSSLADDCVISLISTRNPDIVLVFTENLIKTLFRIVVENLD